MVERRSVLASLGALATIGASTKTVEHFESSRTAERGDSLAAAAKEGESATRAEPDRGVRQVAMVMYPDFFAQDLVGPYTVFASLLNTRVHLVARTLDPITATPGRFPITPSTTFADCPRDLDILLVPGGSFSTVRAMEDGATAEFVRDRAARTRYITSVCTGSLILGAAGLLKGYKATSHWVTHDLLARFGATPTHERVVVDRNRITGAGVTAGIDFGLKVASILDGDDTAQLIQLAIEYDPEPPFQSGSPAHAPPQIKAKADRVYAPFRAAAEEAVARAAQRLGD